LIGTIEFASTNPSILSLSPSASLVPNSLANF
jgi:hypothetical protein